jgi:aspartate/methionine/tyrosine aminotransferase
MFSSRLPAQLASNALADAVERARAVGAVFCDLTETNPTAVGLAYPDLSDVFRSPAIASYRPSALGDPDARAAVAETYGERGIAVAPERIVLTASTSEAYSFVFKLLGEPGDEVLVPQPSYPLFDLLTRLDALVPVPYRLDPAGAWCLDRASVEHALSPRTRAVLIVSPNNPTGSTLHSDDRDWLVGLARRHRLAIVADEVFADYPLAPRPDATTMAGESRALTFTLGGLSKSAGLPQMKLAWMAMSGPDDDVAGALARLEIIADTYLSVSTPVQVSARALLAAGRDIRAAIADRLARNLSALRASVRARPALTLVEPEGGWSAVVRVPAILSEESLVLRLFAEQRVLVHPGYFFDFADEAYVVLSLLPAPAIFDEGITRLMNGLAGV